MADSSLLSAGGQVHVFIGIDVSKAKLDCTLLTAEADKRKTKVVVNTIPAIGPQAGNAILAVMHNRRIDSAQTLAAYLGVVPVQRQSGSSLNSCARLSKAGPSQVRATLYMAALVGTRHNPHIRALYQRLLKAGKSKKAALGAAMRKLVHLCFGVLKNRIPYQPNYAMNA
ncbi:transposase for IS1663 [Bordetella bronchiseptica MO211]|nr:transposase for IS1663 [Bordetella bronchiseptica MO211]